jgi:hypothetical protein
MFQVTENRELSSRHADEETAVRAAASALRRKIESRQNGDVEVSDPAGVVIWRHTVPAV